jgi:beta-lactamase class D
MLASWALALSLSATSLAEHFKGQYGAIEIFDSAAKLAFRVNPPQLTTSVKACASAHLFIAVSALKRALIKPEQSRLTAPLWDQSNQPAYWPKAWRADQELSHALRHATPWYFAQLVAKLDSPAWRKEAEAAGFQVTGTDPEQWQTTVLKQMTWLRQFQATRAGLSAAQMSYLRSALSRRLGKAHRLFGVGGRCPLPDGTALGWQLGWVERAKAPAFYVLTVESKTMQSLAGEPRRIALDGLMHYGLFVP